MSKMAVILLILFSFSLGGVQAVLTMGRRMARMRAAKVQRLRSEKTDSFEHLVMDARDFEAMPVEEVGNGIIEFEYQGYKYDAYEVRQENDKVHLLVIKDHLDTFVHRVYKHSMRYLRRRGAETTYSLFNFYFVSPIQQFSTIRHALEMGIRSAAIHYSLPILDVDFPPPRR